jgi:anti-anti-sigma regulatory factor
MKVKIDTKEKFQVITLMEPILSANIAAELSLLGTKFLQERIKNVVLNLKEVTEIEPEAAEELAQLQNKFYEQSASFVICEITQPLQQMLDEIDLLETMNLAPTESEAWDIVQMEEIERELLDDEEG